MDAEDYEQSRSHLTTAANALSALTEAEHHLDSMFGAGKQPR